MFGGKRMTEPTMPRGHRRRATTLEKELRTKGWCKQVIPKKEDLDNFDDGGFRGFVDYFRSLRDTKDGRFDKRREPFRGKLCAFDPAESLKRPVWIGAIEQGDVPPTTRTSGFAPGDFGVRRCYVADVFPSHPGRELVTIYDHIYSWRAIRIYGLEGRLLYQVWYGGALSAVYWMSDARLLILCGDNAEGYWETRGHPGIEATFPYVIFAIRPTLGFIVAKHLRTDGDAGGQEPGPGWYRCVLPPVASDIIRPRTLTAPFGKYSPGRYVNFGLQYKSNHDAGVELLVDEHGNLVPGAITRSDAYNRDKTLPRIEEIHLGALPPIVRKPSGADDNTRSDATPTTPPGAA